MLMEDTADTFITAGADVQRVTLWLPGHVWMINGASVPHQI